MSEGAQVTPRQNNSVRQPGSQELDTSSMGAWSQREYVFYEREQKGELAFKYIRNDGETNNLIWLINLKNIYSKQLPNMPKEYIARLVFERRHSFQVKGHGTRLMNWTKEYARTKDGLTHFLTYADNNAVGYFAKQGFTKKITLAREAYTGFIKEYDGVTLMEFVIHPQINYATIAATIQNQRQALQERLRSISNSHVVYPPLGKDKEQFKPQDPLSIAGVEQAGYKGPPAPSYEVAVNSTFVPATRENIHAFMRELLNKLSAKEDAVYFLEPVDATVVSDYYDIIQNPMDLGTMKKRVEGGQYYITLEIFLADLKCIWSNAKQYNEEGTIYAKAAICLERYVEEYCMSNVNHQT